MKTFAHTLFAALLIVAPFAAHAQDARSSAAASAQTKTLTIFAAASMKNALDEVDAAYSTKTGVKINASYAASSTLAKQIELGA